MLEKERCSDLGHIYGRSCRELLQTKRDNSKVNFAAK